MRRPIVLTTVLSLVVVAPLPAQHRGPQQDAGLDRFVGAYDVSSGGTAAVSRFVHGGNTIYLFTDFNQGWRGVLVPARGDTFDIVPHEGPAPTGHPRIVASDRARRRPSIELIADGRAPRHAELLDLTVTPVEFGDGAPTLAGEILLPPGEGRMPGIVFVHGSGPATRDDYREWSYFFAANGIATLIYDKRGAGASSGDYRRADFHDLAADAAAAVRRLRSHPRVEAEQVGLSGGSQGAWVAPIAANELDRLAFLVLTGGGPITPAVQEIYRRARLVEDAGHTASQVEAARALTRLYFDYLGSGGDEPTLTRRVTRAWAEHADAPWFSLLSLPDEDPTRGEWPEGRRRFASELHFDVTPFMRSLRVPTLAILGAEDQTFPTDRTVDAYRATVPEHLLTVLVIPETDHGFWVTRGAAYGRHQAPAAFTGMLAWIREQLARQDHSP